ncbi:uncharacterized protein LOC144633867 [Oculina patagonica]
MNGKCPPLYGEGFWIQSPSSSVVTDKTGREICGKRPPYRGRDTGCIFCYSVLNHIRHKEDRSCPPDCYLWFLNGSLG